MNKQEFLGKIEEAKNHIERIEFAKSVAHGTRWQGNEFNGFRVYQVTLDEGEFEWYPCTGPGGDRPHAIREVRPHSEEAKRSSIWLQPEAKQVLEKSGKSLAEAANKVLPRYDMIVERARLPFSESEWNALRDCLNGCWLSPFIRGSIAADLEDTLEDGLAEKWGIDGDLLLSKLQGLSLPDEIATAELIERYWVGVERDTGPR